MTVFAVPELGDAPLDPVFDLAVTTDAEEYTVDDIITVSVTAKNIRPATGLCYVSFRLWFDAASAEPVIKNDGNLNESFAPMLAVSPDKGEWELVGKLCDGYYELAALTDGNKTAKSDGSIRFDIQFKALKTESETASFVVPHANVTCYDANMAGKLYGNGSKVTVPVTEPVFGIKEGSPVYIDGELLCVTAQNLKVRDFKQYFTCDVSISSKSGSTVSDTSSLATGQKLTAPEVSYTVVVFGDVDGNGKIAIADYTIIRRVLWGLTELDTAAYKAACVSGRSKLSVVDYTRIKRYIQGLAPLLP